MRSPTLPATLTLLILAISSHPTHALAQPPSLSSFSPAHPPSLLSLENDLFLTNSSTSSSKEEEEDAHFDLLKRANYCPSKYNSCSTLAAQYSAACCPTTALCSIDSANQVACCPLGAACTGTLSLASSVSSLATTTNSLATTTTSNLYGATSTGTASYVPNAYFPFPYITASATADSSACTSAASTCSTDMAACTKDLAGGGFGVTVQAPNGGVTVAQSMSLGSASASSICSSLASEAGCESVSSCGTGTSSGGFVVQTGAAGRVGMGCVGVAVGAVMVGVGI